MEIGLSYVKSPEIKSRKDLLERRLSQLKAEVAEGAGTAEIRRDKALPLDLIRLQEHRVLNRE